MPLHIFSSCGWALGVSSAQPQAVEVHDAWGGRWVPISSGMRNWRSAVQKWLDAQQMAFSRKPPESSAPPSTSDCTKVEHAPYWPKKGMPSARAAKLDAMIWLFRSPLIIACTSSALRFACFSV